MRAKDVRCTYSPRMPRQRVATQLDHRLADHLIISSFTLMPSIPATTTARHAIVVTPASAAAARPPARPPAVAPPARLSVHVSSLALIIIINNNKMPNTTRERDDRASGPRFAARLLLCAVEYHQATTVNHSLARQKKEHIYRQSSPTRSSAASNSKGKPRLAKRSVAAFR